jgi:hypothetical protein
MKAGSVETFKGVNEEGSTATSSLFNIRAKRFPGSDEPGSKWMWVRRFADSKPLSTAIATIHLFGYSFPSYRIDK